MRLGAALAATLGCCAAALAAAPAASGQRFLLTGADQAVWLLRYDPNGTTFDLAVREADGNWRRLLDGITGRPAAAVASTAQLHVLFAEPTEHVVIGLEAGDRTAALTPDHPLWPRRAAPLALCEAVDPNSGLPGGILAAVARPAERASAQPATGHS